MAVQITKEEAAALLSVDVDPNDCAVIEAISVQVQAVSEGRDANGTPTIVFGFFVPLPAGLLRPKSAVLGPDGMPVGGGLMDAIPLPPRVRMLVKLANLPPSMAAELRATQKAANDAAAAPVSPDTVIPFPTLRPRE